MEDGGAGEATSSEALSTTERRYMYFEGSCHFLACCSKRDCSRPASRVLGYCGTGCSDTTPWIARPRRDRRYACGECVKVCLAGTTDCVEAAVWDDSVSDGGIEGNIALFDALGLPYTENARSCSGTGGAYVDVGPCTGGADEGPTEDPTTDGSFAGVYCTSPGHPCGGNSPCWPARDCPSGSTCDWSAGSWGRCMD